jgi:hypothetical protein
MTTHSRTEEKKRRKKKSECVPSNPFISLWPHGLTTSQRPHLLIPPQWGLSFNTCILEDIQTITGFTVKLSFCLSSSKGSTSTNLFTEHKLVHGQRKLDLGSTAILTEWGYRPNHTHVRKSD